MYTSVLRCRADEDATVEGRVVSLSWDAEPDACLEAAVARSCALRSTPCTILEPDGWLSLDDEKLMLHVREHFVVLDLLEEASLRLGGQSLDCVCPGFQRRGIEGFREEVAIFFLSSTSIMAERCKNRGYPVTLWEGKEEEVHRAGWCGVCMLNSTTHFMVV